MIPRCSFRLPIRLFQEPARLDISKPSASHLRTFTTTLAQNAKSKIGSRAHKNKRLKSKPIIRDPYTLRLLAAKKAAIIARKQELETERAGARGDPVYGVAEPTPFIKSLKLAMPEDKIHIRNAADSDAPATPPGEVNTTLTSQDEILSPANTGVASPPHLNDFLTPEDLDRYTRGSRDLSRPLPKADRDTADPQAEAQAAKAHEVAHAIRTAALARITSIENTNSKQRSRINTTRIVEELGRHTTDTTLRPRVDREGKAVAPKERVGPDTGSSEVQIGLLTAKIKVLAAAYAGKARNDKANKRNLRLLLHRRQKLLRYFWRKDRGGDRWTNMIEKLGLTPATWEGEIELR